MTAPGRRHHGVVPGPYVCAVVTVRLPRDEELDDAGRVVVEAYRADGIGNDEYLAKVADARRRAADAAVAVALDEAGAVVGSVTFCLPGSPWAELSRPGEAEFRMLGVAPTARGRGVGEALVRWCLDQARQAAATKVVISSQDVMTAAHRLYDRLGFSRRPDLDWTPVPGVDLLGFERELGQLIERAVVFDSACPCGHHRLHQAAFLWPGDEVRELDEGLHVRRSGGDEVVLPWARTRA